MIFATKGYSILFLQVYAVGRLQMSACELVLILPWQKLSPVLSVGLCDEKFEKVGGLR